MPERITKDRRNRKKIGNYFSPEKEVATCSRCDKSVAEEVDCWREKIDGC